MKTLQGHTAAVRDIALHPSGRLLLSVAADKSLRVWDMVKGNCAYTLRLKQEGVKVRWSVGGEFYAILMDRELDIYSTDSGNEL